MNRDTLGFWEKTAKLYTGFMAKNDRAYDAVCGILGRYIRPDSRVLELACGTGQITFRMARSAHEWIATDYSPAMLREAEKRAEREAPGCPITFQAENAARLSFADGGFDTVVIANALHIIPDPAAALSEIRRVLKPGGLLCAPTFVYDGRYSKTQLWLMARLGFRTFHKWQRNELTAFVGQAGFRIIEAPLIEGRPLPECVLIAVNP